MSKKTTQSVGKRRQTVGKRRQVPKKCLRKCTCLRKRAFAYGKRHLPTVGKILIG